MNLIVVYKGIGKIAADQLKKLVNQKDDNGEYIIGSKDDSIEIIAMDEEIYLQNAKTNPFKDPILFIGDVKGGSEIKPIAQPKGYGFGVICGFAGPQAVLTVNAKAVSTKKDYDAFFEALNSLTFQQITKVPKGKNAVMDSFKHGVIGTLKRKDSLKKQQLIYGVTKLYYEDLQEFMTSYGKRNGW